ncbi:hypothetical protein LUZ60_000195 [Juncus effusus]|nr:hypothetical protein LUZ60_000195 [Juncus effusus]
MGDGYDLFIDPNKGPDYVIKVNIIRIGICCPLIILCLFLTNYVRFSPTTTLEKIYIPSLDKNKNSSTDTTLTFEIKLKNLNNWISLYYDPVNITFYDNPNRLHSVANFTAPHFDQGWGVETKKGGTVNTTGFDREAAMKSISANGYWIIRVDLVTSFRYKAWWKSRTQKYKVGADIHLGDTGIKVHHKDKARLVSGATKIGSSFERFGFILISLFVAWFLCSYGV